MLRAITHMQPAESCVVGLQVTGTLAMAPAVGKFMRDWRNSILVST